MYEPGLDALVAKNREEGRLQFATDLATAVAGADAVAGSSEFNRVMVH